uniref:Uncharacterized protein n=1 Tax=Cacopsylla melanoneura TaxID=428564 RepID=A0A8D9DRR1_9HEMI
MPILNYLYIMPIPILLVCTVKSNETNQVLSLNLVFKDTPYFYLLPLIFPREMFPISSFMFPSYFALVLHPSSPCSSQSNLNPFIPVLQSQRVQLINAVFIPTSIGIVKSFIVRMVKYC